MFLAIILKSLARVSVGCALALLTSVALYADWIPISKEDLQATECPTDPDAPAEILYKAIENDEGRQEFRYRNVYIQTKVYNKQGVDMLENIQIFYNRTASKLSGLKARVVKKDGTVIEMDDDDFYSQKEKKDSDRSVYSVSFTPRGLEPGDVIEYSYRIDLLSGYYTPTIFINFQEPWPIRHVNIRVRPAIISGYRSVKWITSNCKTDEMKRNSDGFYEINVRDVAAHKEESYQPPEKSTAAWLTFYLAKELKLGDSYWLAQGKELAKLTQTKASPGGLVKAKLAEIVKPQDSAEDKLQKIYAYCAQEIRNSVYGSPDSVTADERKKLENDTSAERVLKMGYGRPININMVFCALARAAGFDARIAAISDRHGYAFSKTVSSIETVLPGRVIAVRGNSESNWRFFDPGSKFLALGEMEESKQFSPVLIGDKKEILLYVTKVAPIDFTKVVSKADLALDVNGMLGGELEFEATGYAAINIKKFFATLGSDARIDKMKSVIEQELGDATVESIKIFNAEDCFKPLIVRCELVPIQYADVIGDRMFIQPNFFRKWEDSECLNLSSD